MPISDLDPRAHRIGVRGQSQSNAVEVDHRELLRKRHEQIPSGSVAAGFVHPTHLYRRDADVLPTPDKAYNMTITQDTISPDGFERLGFLMNGKFPADPFVWDENDDVEITVTNNGPVPFAIHWHGIHQIGSPEMDGVPGLSQWNIYTGESYTYRFKLLNQYGGYWYHSHERGYYADGLRGTIYIRPKPNRKKPWSLISQKQEDIDQMEAAEKDFQVMALSDHWHINHTEMLLVVHETGVPPACFDSLHINGRGRQYCLNDWTKVISPIQSSLLKNFSSTNPDGITSKGCISLVPPKPGYTVKGTLDSRYGGPCQNTTAPMTVFSATKAISKGRKWLNLQVVDTSTNWYMQVSIDGHKIWLVAVDGHYVQPMQVDVAQITIGSRISLMVELNSSLEGNIFPIRLTGARALQPIEGHAFLSYIDDIDGSWFPGQEEDFGYAMRTLSKAHLPMSGFVTDTSVVKWRQNASVPFDPISQVPLTSNMTLHAVASQNSLNVWQVATMPIDTARLADDRPILFNATDGNATSNQMTPYATIPFGTVVDIIMENNIYSIVGGPNSPHPFHMHSRRFWIIGSGAGPFPADTVAEAQQQGTVFNLLNPPLRDGFDIDSNSWVVIRYVADHAAANILHCHIDDHAIEGMAAVLLEGLETIPAGGNFSDSVKARPPGWVETKTDELGQVLEAAWATGSVNAKYEAPAPTDTVDPWGDPRSLAESIQLYASSNSVLKALTSSLLSEMSAVEATATRSVTAITATVSDQLTTFTGVDASTGVFATQAFATTTAGAPASSAINAAATLAGTTDAETNDSPSTAAATATLPLVTGTLVTSANTAQSTLFAVAYTTEVVTAASATAANSASLIAGVVTSSSTSTVFVTVLGPSSGARSVSSSPRATGTADLSATHSASSSLANVTPQTTANAAVSSTRRASVSTARTASSTLAASESTSTAHTYSAIATQQVISTTFGSLDRAASTSVQVTDTSIRPTANSETTLTTQTASIRLSSTAVGDPATPASSEPAVNATLNPANYGTNAATVTFPANPTSATAAASEATATASDSDDEPAYDSPVFPTASATTAATQTQIAVASTSAAFDPSSSSADDGDDGEEG
ncbi:laccase-1 [Pseudozyma hubeiensis SY62]|uniref:Laccase-1 n=1 Tax=Pseudozyma hubeiensis (strain SY62) TaxID=1305764 RepID=R9P950_PSEHS|nr:laccase-1 [Pseudozyma hubeiensis SY62]GAC97881.1 laccase-1 [Pseudozyma hubeiensis SY62]